MKILARCDCGQAYRLNEGRAGEVFVCTVCGKRFLVPDPLRAVVRPLQIPPYVLGLRSAVILLVLLMYAIACVLPVLHAPDGTRGTGHTPGHYPYGTSEGWVALLLGALPPFTIPWAANLFLPFALERLWSRKFNTAAWLGGTACLLALTTKHFVTTGNNQPHAELLIGYWFWQGAMALTLAAAVTCRLLCTREPAEPPPAEPPAPMETKPFAPPES